MIFIVSQIIGIAAVVLYLLSFQFKKRKGIILATCFSYFFYVTHYLLLGAFSGAISDLLSGITSVLAGRKNEPKFKKYAKLATILSCSLIVISGLTIAILRHDWVELLPIAGALLQAGGLWAEKEQNIRLFALAGAPFWLVYNFICMAYGATIGAILTIVSVVIALIRYRKEKNLK